MKSCVKYLFYVVVLFLLGSCVRDVYVNEPEVSQPKNSKLIITSKPSGALIYLNGKNMGIYTPDSLTWLQPGSCTVTLKLELFPDHTQKFEINDDARLDYFYDYTTDPANLGTIDCSSTPAGAEIFVNDSSVNRKTPSAISSLLPGSYKVKVTYPLHRADSIYTDVRGSKTNKIYFALEDTSVWVSYNTKNSPLTSNIITSIAVDQNNIKWIGTNDGSVFSFDGKKWNSTNFGNYVSYIYPDNSGSVWVGTLGNVEQYQGKWTDYARFFQSPNVSSIVVDRGGTVWVATDFGIYFYNGEVWIGYQYSDEVVKLTNPIITALTVDLQGRVWICTVKGITIYDGTKWQAFFTSSLGLPGNIGSSIVDVKVDKEGVAWVAIKEDVSKGYTGGLIKYDGTVWSVVTIPGFPTNHIQRINVDNDGNKWISTVNGICRFKQPDNPLIFNLSNSKIPGNVVSGSIVDKNGDLWVATFGGGIGKLKKNNIPIN